MKANQSNDCVSEESSHTTCARFANTTNNSFYVLCKSAKQVVYPYYVGRAGDLLLKKINSRNGKPLAKLIARCFGYLDPEGLI